MPQVESFIPLWEWDEKKKSKKKADKKEKGKGKGKGKEKQKKSNNGSSHVSVHTEEVDDSGDSGPLNRAVRMEEVLDEDA